ncbi:aspartate aminotransferase family protein [Thioclava sp. GXIMD4216]|uniref:aspartate aminotransferase family protein n=1 Tax=Thioclava sp. GXIMD4216 TaxID=3131929 RepID=UPI0030D5A5BB
MIPSVLPTYNRAPLAFTRGSGSWLETEDGSRYLDMGAGIAVNVLGHAAPELVEALTDQAQKLWHVSNLYQIPLQQKLADMLVENTFADTVFFTNSGTEAAELAIKMARKYWYSKGVDRTEIITFDGAFHGRSTGAISAVPHAEKMVKGFGPLLPGFHQIAWGDMDLLKSTITDKTAAIWIEPVQGEGGIRPLPEADMKALRALCDETGILLIFDEVQCGVARTGKLFAHEWSGVTPDIMMMAKGIGGGFPLGGVLATEEAASGMVAGTHGSTYGGNPLGCAIGAKVIEIVNDPAFLEAVNAKAGFMRQKLEGLVATHPDVFEEVRGMGLMLGLKCKVPCGDVVQAAYAQHLLTVPAGDNVLRLLPALNISEEDLAEAVNRLDKAAQSLEVQSLEAKAN